MPKDMKIQIDEVVFIKISKWSKSSGAVKKLCAFEQLSLLRGRERAWAER